MLVMVRSKDGDHLTEAGAELHAGNADHHGNGKDGNHSVGTYSCYAYC